METKELFIYVRRVSDDEIVLQKRWSLRAGMPDRDRLLDEAVFADGIQSGDGRNRREYYIDDFEVEQWLRDNSPIELSKPRAVGVAL